MAPGTEGRLGFDDTVKVIDDWDHPKLLHTGDEMIDRTTKFLLVAVALGLWLNIGLTIMRPAPAAAQDTAQLSQLENYVAEIANGVCVNRKICG